MRTRMSIGGHPVHAMLVPIPIGLFLFAFVADLVYLARGRDALWSSIAFWCVTGGIIGALAAAIPGFGDYFTTPMSRQARRAATVHMVLNLALVVIFGASLVLFRDAGIGAERSLASDQRATTAILLHGIGVLVMGVSGWLGGDMVYRHRIGVEPGAGRGAGTGLDTDEERRRTGREVEANLADEQIGRPRRDIDH